MAQACNAPEVCCRGFLNHTLHLLKSQPSEDLARSSCTCRCTVELIPAGFGSSHRLIGCKEGPLLIQNFLLQWTLQARDDVLDALLRVHLGERHVFAFSLSFASQTGKSNQPLHLSTGSAPEASKPEHDVPTSRTLASLSCCNSNVEPAVFRPSTSRQEWGHDDCPSYPAKHDRIRASHQAAVA